jgi:translation initiation factor 2-alpha kinase 4
VASLTQGLLEERLSIARDLWAHNIATDVQYEDNAANTSLDRLVQQCRQQGISWIVITRHRNQEARNAATLVQVKNVLQRSERSCN